MPEPTYQLPRRQRRILVPFGTRPEIVKLAPVVTALRKAGHHVTAVHTGQHASAAMSANIADEAGLVPDIARHLSPERDQRVGQLHSDALHIIREERPELVLVLGDTDTVPAYALAARRHGVPFAHLEAGLRSFNARSVEELNRRIATAGAAIHFAPTARARSFLLFEGVVDQRIFVVGNPIVDTLTLGGWTSVFHGQRRGVLVTAHRPTNVDDSTRLARLVGLINELARHIGPVLFPVHPRTEEKLSQGNLRREFVQNVALVGPLEHREVIDRLRHAQIVVTDSGGLQEEAAFFGVPVVVLRGSTPRWEGVENGSAVLASLATDEGASLALAAARRLVAPVSLARVASLACPYGDGTTSTKVAEIFSDPTTDDLLALDEPTFGDGDLPWSRR